VSTCDKSSSLVFRIVNYRNVRFIGLASGPIRGSIINGLFWFICDRTDVRLHNEKDFFEFHSKLSLN